MEDKQFYKEAAIRAVNNAAFKVVKHAIQNNLKIPIWKENHVVYEVPKGIIISKN